MSGGAKVQKDDASDASGKSFVAGLGNQFVTNESGKAGYGDQTRVEADANHVPTVAQNNKGTMTVTGVPAGAYNMVVRFSNDAFIGSHSYNPQVVDLGLQMREGDQEIARGSFRYTYTEKHFMNRSVTVTTHGGALTLGNWDEVGSRKAAVSWGVAPNVDSITFYPITDGNVIDSVSGVTVSGEGVSADGKASLKVGETLSLNASVTPDSVADKTVQWTSSDEQVATVDEHGVVKGVKAGTVTITATSVADSSRSGSVEVTVAEDSEQKPSGGDGDNNGEQTGKPDGNTGGQTSDSDAGADSGNNQKHMPLTGAAVAAVAGVAVLLAGAGLLLKRLRSRS